MHRRGAPPITGGCLFPVDPDLDARDARPRWCDGARPTVGLIPHDDPAAQVFDLWAVPGTKTLEHDGERLHLHGIAGRELVSLQLDADVRNGAPFAYAVPAGVDPERCPPLVQMALSLMQEPRASTPGALSRPPREATMHMRTLQALDGADAGASQREIASVLFGARRVSEEWAPDSEVRAQLRYLLQRGRKLVAGGYRTLLH